MTLRQRKRMLWTVNVASAAALIVCVAAAVFCSLDVGLTREPADENVAPGADDEQRKVEPLSAYAGIYQRDLRKPLYDVTPVQIVKPEPTKPKLTVTLVGTAVEPGFTYGLFRTKSGETKFVRVGETIKDTGVEVLEITQDAARVRFAGEILTLKVRREGA